MKNIKSIGITFDRKLILIFMIIYDFHFISMFFSFFLSRPTRLQDSDGEKSDQDLVVDIANETVSSKELVKQTIKTISR